MEHTDESPLLLEEIRADYLGQLHTAFGTAEDIRGRVRRRRGERHVRGHDSVPTRSRLGGLASKHGNSSVAVVLSGLSGVGKSSITDTFSRQAQGRGHYARGVLRINAASACTLQSSIRELIISAGASHLLRSTSDIASDRHWSQVLAALHPTAGTLFIVDNVQDENSMRLSDFSLSAMWKVLLPNANFQHHLLIISQCSNLPACLSRHISRHIEVLPLTGVQSAWMLARLNRSLCAHCALVSTGQELWCQLYQTCRSGCNMLQAQWQCCTHCLAAPLRNAESMAFATQVQSDRSQRRCCTHRAAVERSGMNCKCIFRLFSELFAESENANGMPLLISCLALPASDEAASIPTPVSSQVDGRSQKTGNCETSSEQDIWRMSSQRLSQAAKQLLCLCAFLNPDRISSTLFCRDEICAPMPGELHNVLSGKCQNQASSAGCAGRKETLDLHGAQSHVLAGLLCELRSLSLVGFVSPLRHSSRSLGVARHDVAYEFCLHRAVRKLVLSELYGSAQADEYLRCCLSLLCWNIASCQSIVHLEINVFPHILQVNPTSVLRMAQYCGYYLATPSLDATVLLSLMPSEESRLSCAHVLKELLGHLWHHKFMLKYLSEDVVTDLTHLKVTTPSAVSVDLFDSDNEKRMLKLIAERKCGSKEEKWWTVAIAVFCTLPRDIVVESLAIALPYLIQLKVKNNAHDGSDHATSCSTYAFAFSTVTRFLSNSVGTDPALPAAELVGNDLLKWIEDCMRLIVFSRCKAEVIRRALHNERFGERLTHLLNVVCRTNFNLYSRASVDTGDDIAVADTGDDTAVADAWSAHGVCKKMPAAMKKSVIKDLHHADIQLVRLVTAVEEMYGGSYISGLLYVPLLAIVLYWVGMGETRHAIPALNRAIGYLPLHFPLNGSQLRVLMLRLLAGESRSACQFLEETELYD
eukprot:scpid27782/ scgid17277/ 